jgi:folate-dependent phosphoribosylglycinamide formyltransferase PurN
MRALKVFIISQDEPFYVPKTIRHLLENQGAGYKIVGGTVLAPHRKNKTIYDWAAERIQVYTLWELFITTFMFIYCKINRLLLPRLGCNGSQYSAKDVFRSFDIPTIHTNDINKDTYIQELNKLDLDIIISISPPQLFGKELLAVPRKYCLNAHGTLLPRHRGVFGSWWTIFQGDKEGGATIHTMELRLDAGQILWQESFEIEPGETQYSVAYKTKRMIARGLVDVLAEIAFGREAAKPVIFDQSYHRAPTRQQGREFHSKGLQIIKIKDCKNILVSKRDEKISFLFRPPSSLS